MNLTTARVAFRERPLTDVFDLALRFVVVHGRVYASLSAIVLVPCLLVAWLASKVGWELAWVVAIPLASIATVPFTLLASRLVFEEVPRARDIARAALAELPGIVGLRLVTGFGIAVAAIAFVAPMFWASAVVFFADEVKLLERSGTSASIARAQRLAGVSLGGALLGSMMLLGVRVAAVALADVAGRTVLGELLQFRPPPSAFSAGGSVLCLLGLFAVVPFYATARFFAYLDVRTRTEGWDVQTRFAALAARAEADARAVEAR